MFELQCKLYLEFLYRTYRYYSFWLKQYIFSRTLIDKFKWRYSLEPLCRFLSYRFICIMKSRTWYPWYLISWMWCYAEDDFGCMLYIQRWTPGLSPEISDTKEPNYVSIKKAKLEYSYVHVYVTAFIFSFLQILDSHCTFNGQNSILFQFIKSSDWYNSMLSWNLHQ